MTAGLHRSLLPLFVICCLLAGVLALPSRLSAQEDAIHVVQPGETLSEIAQQHATTTAELLALNGVADADAIFVGQRLRVPSGGEQTAEPAPPGMHRVQPGETLIAIARLYGVDPAELMALNAIEDADALISGQLLTLPGFVAPAPPTPETPAVEPTALPLDTPLPAATAATIPAAAPDIHAVQPGETLSGIAKRYGLPLATLKALNAIGDANRIFVGQELILAVPTPQPDVTTETPIATAPPAEAAPAATEHTVAAGETLSSIAARYGVTLEVLKDRNGITDENAIFPGQVLALAPAVATPSPTITSTATGEPETAEALATVAPTAIVRSGNPAASLNATYTVRSGDTLGRIALRLGIDQDALAALNGFGDLGARLVSGQELLLPATGDELRTTEPAQRHTVKPGETLSAIAQSFDVTTADILAANRIADANAIYPGQELAIPPKTPPNARQVGPARGGYYYYTVQPGDTLSAVAAQFNTTMQAVREYNGLPDNETIYTGLEIRIPHGAPPLTLRFPPVPRSGHRFIISLSRQQCWVYQGDRLLYAWNCSTGYGERKTKAGNYAVQSRIANAKSNIWRLDMPYWLGIYDVGVFENGIHGLPMDWDSGKKIWSALIGQPATFGCAMLDDLNAATLFRLAYLGMPVNIIN